MLQRLSCAALSAVMLVSAVSAGAEPTAPATAKPVDTAKPADAAKPAAAAKPAEVRRDPLGIKGISPFTEALKRGDSALLARDIEGAIVAYRDALAIEPQNALGQYRLGEAQILKGDLSAAEEA